MSMGTADACAGGGSAVYGNIVTESAALKPAGCGAQVTEQAAKAWHSGTGLRAVRHRKPAAVTQAGYTYCQLRKTRTVSTIPAWARTSERRSLTIYMRACPRGHATPRCLILPEPQLPLAAQQFAGAELQSLDSPCDLRRQCYCVTNGAAGADAGHCALVTWISATRID